MISKLFAELLAWLICTDRNARKVLALINTSFFFMSKQFTFTVVITSQLFP